jgi:hypothetical protein
VRGQHVSPPQQLLLLLQQIPPQTNWSCPQVMHSPFTQLLPLGQQLVPQMKPPFGQTQLPLTQSAPVGQPRPQAPQLLVVFSGLQVPLQQPSPLAHRLPQAPQLAVSVWRLTHTPLQRVKPVGQVPPPPPRPPPLHCPLTQLLPLGQT